MIGVYRAYITRIEAGGQIHVRIPRIAGELEFGPLDGLATPMAYAPGDQVVVGFEEGRAEDPIVLGRFG